MKKGLKWIAVVMVFFALVTGCGKKEKSASSAAKTDGGKNVSIWTWTPIPRTINKMISAFEKDNSDIKISYTNYNYNPEYLAALAAGAGSNTLGDILGLQPGSLTQQYKDYLIDLSAYAKTTWGDNWMDKFYKIDADQIKLGNATGDNSVYILPVESQIINIIYNKKIFDELGLSVPTTWQQLKDVSKKLTKAGYAPLYFGGADGWQHVNLFLMLAYQYGDFVTEAQKGSVRWTDPVFEKTMTAFKDMFDSGIIQVGALSNNAYPDGVNLFTAGKIGMMALGSWWWQEYTAPDPVENVKNWVYDSFYLPPYIDGGKASPPIGGMDFGYGISKSCKNPDAAWKVLASFVGGVANQEAINDLNNLPAFKTVKPQGEIPERLKNQINAYASKLDVAVNQRIASPEIEVALQNACQGVASGQLTIKKALAELQAAQDKILKQ